MSVVLLLLSLSVFDLWFDDEVGMVDVSMNDATLSLQMIDTITHINHQR
jgi:hypothetical protein